MKGNEVIPHCCDLMPFPIVDGLLRKDFCLSAAQLVTADIYSLILVNTIKRIVAKSCVGETKIT